MSGEDEKQIPRSVMADKFIDVANEFTKTEPKERVSVAFMFAASRYNAFEAFSKSGNLLKDKEDACLLYTSPSPRD